MNTACPVMPDEEVDPRFTLEFEGVTVGVCCRKCLRKFRENPEAYASNLVGFLPQPQAPPPELEKEHQHGAETEPAGVAPEAHADHGEHAEQGEHEHDHSVHAETPRSGLVVWLGKLHPPATHLPIGLLLGGALAEALFIRTRREVFRHSATFCVVVGGAGAVLAASLGWFNGGFILVDADWVQLVHRWLGTAVAFLGTMTALSLLGRRADETRERPRQVFRALLFGTASRVGAAGFFGGALVYGLDHYLIR